MSYIVCMADGIPQNFLLTLAFDDVCISREMPALHIDTDSDAEIDAG